MFKSWLVANLQVPFIALAGALSVIFLIVGVGSSHTLCFFVATTIAILAIDASSGISLFATIVIALLELAFILLGFTGGVLGSGVSLFSGEYGSVGFFIAAAVISAGVGVCAFMIGRYAKENFYDIVSLRWMYRNSAVSMYEEEWKYSLNRAVVTIGYFIIIIVIAVFAISSTRPPKDFRSGTSGVESISVAERAEETTIYVNGARWNKTTAYLIQDGGSLRIVPKDGEKAFSFVAVSASGEPVIELSRSSSNHIFTEDNDTSPKDTCGIATGHNPHHLGPVKKHQYDDNVVQTFSVSNCLYHLTRYGEDNGSTFDNEVITLSVSEGSAVVFGINLYNKRRDE